MLHEILLSLAGHSSPLFRNDFTNSKHDAEDDLQLSSSERQLLTGIANLSQHHQNLKRHLNAIAQRHSSIVCRAVANSLLQTHLRRFTARILEVESKILRKDASTVGAYDIVPLAYVVGQFDEWQRPMAWFWTLSTFIMSKDGQYSHTGAKLIDRLRSDAQTGFPDIERVALELSAVADLAWLKQLASWVLHGKLNGLGAIDFFVQEEVVESESIIFRRHKNLAPSFVNDRTARSILFIGRSLNHMKQNKQAMDEATAGLDALVAHHMQMLTEITFPITSAQLAHTVSKMRASLSRNILQDLLPIHTTRTALQCLQRYLLLSNTDFASCLVNEAERRGESRWQSMDRLAQKDPIKALQGLSLKDADMSQVLRQTLKTIAFSAYDDREDDVLEYAKKHLSLTVAKKASSRPSTSDGAAEDRPKLSPVAFNDLLFGTPTNLVMNVKPPLDLLLSSFDIGLYSAINAYLLAIRKAQLRLEELWRRNTARRYKSRSLDVSALRRGWATSSAALLVLSELAAYLNTSVTQPACEDFQRWACSSIGLASESHQMPKVQRDPESISAGHRAFLDALIQALLLTDLAYTKELRSLLGSVEQMSSLFTRWLDEQDITEPGVSKATSDTRVAQELERACERVVHDQQMVITLLKEAHHNRVDFVARYDRDTGGYEPLRLGGLDHLILKLEYERC